LQEPFPLPVAGFHSFLRSLVPVLLHSTPGAVTQPVPIFVPEYEWIFLLFISDGYQIRIENV
jgi:hypothetical protein